MLRKNEKENFSPEEQFLYKPCQLKVDPKRQNPLLNLTGVLGQNQDIDDSKS